jgi:putative transposase
MRRAYLTDLSDAEWTYLQPHLPAPKIGGRPRVHSLREILDAIFYIARSGCAWRLLPHDFPPWKTIHHYFRIWRIDGTWERLNSALRERLRVRLGRNRQPSAGVVDSRSAKTTGVGGEQRGYDGGKKARGRKRHLLVDTEGLVIKAKVHSAKVPDQDGIELLLRAVGDRLPRLSHLWVDAGYQGRGKEWVEKVLEPVSKPHEVAPADKRAGEGEEGHMHDRVAFPADAQAPVVVQPREGTLDHPTPSPKP